jgi:protein-disulfide isomerase
MDNLDNAVEDYEGTETDTTHPKLEPADTLTFKRTHVYSALLPLAFVIGLAVGYLFWGRGATPPPDDLPQAVANNAPEQNQQSPSQPTQAQEVRRYSIPEDDDPVFGPSEAPITIIEFSDFQCPYCKKWHVEVWPRLQEAFPDQIRLVYRDFPLASIHPNATSAAEAANCANEQDKYWEYNYLLFNGDQQLGLPGYQVYAEELMLDMDLFNECLESDRYSEEINADFQFAANLGVSSTPTFFINGIPLVGAQPFEVFSQLINQELAGEIP